MSFSMINTLLLLPLLAISSTNASSFVTRTGNSFELNGLPFIAVGPNAFWLGLKQDPITTYPTHSQIEEMFIVACYMNSTVIRSHTLGITSGSNLSLRPANLNTKKNVKPRVGSNVFNVAAWETIDYSYMMAEKYGIKLVVPLTDSYAYYLGNYGDWCISRGVDKIAFFTDLNVRADFKDAIRQYLDHINQYTGVAIKDSPAIFMIELGNEMGNYRPASTSTAIPTQEWLADIVAYIKTIDMNHHVLDPTDEALGGSISQDFSVAQIDAYSSHFYYTDQSRMRKGVKSTVSVDKPYVIGEFGSGMGVEFYSLVESLKGIKGSMFWSLHPHVNGIDGGAMIPHNDGFSVWFPEDRVLLLRIANHFQRMRGIPVTANIGPESIAKSVRNTSLSSTTSTKIHMTSISMSSASTNRHSTSSASSTLSYSTKSTSDHSSIVTRTSTSKITATRHHTYHILITSTASSARNYRPRKSTRSKKRAAQSVS